MSLVYDKILSQKHYQPADDWLRIKTIDMHTAGEPLRVVIEGIPQIKGNSVLDYRRYMMTHHDTIRKILMFEPRGHSDMYGCILVPPNDNSADFGILFMHNEGFSTMCGHAIIAISKLAIEMGWKEKTHPYSSLEIDAPCGRISSRVYLDNQGDVIDVSFDCVPSFVVGLNYEVEVNGQVITYDLAYGGAFYAYINADLINLSLSSQNVQEIIQLGRTIKKAIIQSNHEIKHPFEKDLSFLYGTIFISQHVMNNSHDRNVCVFANGEVDRSPTGSGVSGRMAIHAARGEMTSLSQPRAIESIIGSQFLASIKKNVDFGSYSAVVPTVRGTAYIIGQNEWYLDPKDGLPEGFLLS
jgi:trans-L-3-hydroxyproline dehydratase